jgi:hypothetical protein
MFLYTVLSIHLNQRDKMFILTDIASRLIAAVWWRHQVKCYEKLVCIKTTKINKEMPHSMNASLKKSAIQDH